MTVSNAKHVGAGEGGGWEEELGKGGGGAVTVEAIQTRDRERGGKKESGGTDSKNALNGEGGADALAPQANGAADRRAAKNGSNKTKTVDVTAADGKSHRREGHAEEEASFVRDRPGLIGHRQQVFVPYSGSDSQPPFFLHFFGKGVKGSACWAAADARVLHSPRHFVVLSVGNVGRLVRVCDQSC